MGRYTIRRLLQMIPVIIGTTFIIYAMVWALPGDPFAGKCGDRPCPAAYVAEMRDKFNLDDSLPVQYVKYLGNLVQGNLGESFSGRSVWSEIAAAFPVTFRLALIAIIVEIVIGISAGILAALNRGG
ncbi:MAG: ABC transporter permease, partial [Candidatus Nanopelagicales bacterium]|nr:ABC transporter permease [Candidatus Nanopelagicales bacterium]